MSICSANYAHVSTKHWSGFVLPPIIAFHTPVREMNILQLHGRICEKRGHVTQRLAVREGGQAAPDKTASYIPAIASVFRFGNGLTVKK